MTTNSPNPVDGDVQALIADCQNEIAELEKRLTTCGEAWIPYLQSKLKRQQIALAALTAKPVDFRWRWARDENAVWTYCRMDKYQDAINAFADNATFEMVYTTPPAQILRPVELPQAFAYTIEGMEEYVNGWWLRKSDVIEGLRQQGYEVKS